MGRNDGKKAQAEKEPMLTKTNAKREKKHWNIQRELRQHTIQSSRANTQFRRSNDFPPLCAYAAAETLSLTNPITRTSHKHTHSQQESYGSFAEHMLSPVIMFVLLALELTLCAVVVTIQFSKQSQQCESIFVHRHRTTFSSCG